MARDESELQGRHRLPAAHVWTLNAFTQFIIHVVFAAKGMRDAAEASPTPSALISRRVVQNAEKAGQRPAWLPASQRAQSTPRRR